MRPRSTCRHPFCPRVEVLEGRELLAVCTVDRLTDGGQGQGMAGDLRYCIQQAQDGDSIRFGVNGTIGLTQGQLFLTTNITVEGPGADRLTVRATLNNRAFTVVAGVTASFAGLTISRGGDTNIFNSGTLTLTECVIADAYVGNGVYNQGTMEISNCVLRNNIANPRGGGISNNGMLTITDSTILGNRSSQGDGGGIANSGTMTVRNTTISVNDSSGPGGGIANTGTLTVSGSTLSGNRGGRTGGGGIANTGTLTILDSCIWGNAAPTGGGIYHAGNGSKLVVTNSTISGNLSGPPVGETARGGGIHALNASTASISQSTITDNEAQNGTGGGIHVQGAAVMLWNTIIAGNTARSSPDYFGPAASSGFNLIGNTEGGSGFRRNDLLNLEPRLGPLQDNGGPTRTHALLAGSPALDRGHPKTSRAGFDQRGEGFARVVGSRVDIGAFEVQEQGFRGAATLLLGFDLAAWLAGRPQPNAAQIWHELPQVVTAAVRWQTVQSVDENPAGHQRTVRAADGRPMTNGSVGGQPDAGGAGESVVTCPDALAGAPGW